MATPQTEFGERIASRTARVGIIGLGYAGLPLAMSFAEAGFGVTGIDLNAERVRAVRERKAYLVDVPEERYGGSRGAHGLDRLLGRPRAGRPHDLRADAAVEDRTPDVRHIVAAAESVAANLRPGQLIVLQSTTYPGTTEEIVQPILERTGAKVGEDFFLGYAPERVDPGTASSRSRTRPSSSPA